MAVAARKIPAPEIQSGLWERYVRAPHPDVPSVGWHISPVIDMTGYHFSWLWALLPMMLAARFVGSGDQLIVDYSVYALTIGVTIAHRHFGLPYAYFDREVFQMHRRQLTWFPLACVAMFIATPLVLKMHGVGLLNGVIFFAVIWNLWHVYMQKFGILRLYMAKDPAPVERKTEAWVDKCLLFCWFPLYFSYLGPKYKNVIYMAGPEIKQYTSAIIDFMEYYSAWLVVPSLIIAAGAIGMWLWRDWRAHRLRNRARLSAAAGTTLISTALFWTNPVFAYIAFGFSHAIEYLAFVWAFQRRRYSRPQAHPSLMQKLLHHPKTWYTLSIGTVTAIGIYQVALHSPLMHQTASYSFAGMTGSKWLLYYTTYQSLTHFYSDGFLWKMRRPEVRANI